MTTKRFKMTSELPKGWVDIIDTANNQTLCNIRIEYANHMVTLLNELHEEVMDLRRENTKFKLTISEIIEDMQKYIDDNQLVYINQSYVDWIKKEVDTTLYSQKKELKDQQTRYKNE